MTLDTRIVSTKVTGAGAERFAEVYLAIAADPRKPVTEPLRFTRGGYDSYAEWEADVDACQQALARKCGLI